MSKFAELCRRAAFFGIAAVCFDYAAPLSVSAQGLPGQAPIAQDDLIVTSQDRGELIITTLLANDSDPERGALSIVSVTQAKGGTVTLDPLKPKQVIFKPNGNFSGLYSFTYEIEDPQGLRATATVTIQNPFLQGKGLYAGPIAGAASVPNSNGHVTLTLTGGGTFTGKLRFGGEVISFSGMFELDGTYQADFQISAKERRRLQLTLPLDGPGGPVTGLYSGGEQTIAFSLPRMTFTRNDPPPFVGDFTIGFLPPDEQKTTPAGIGYGILRVSAIGSVSYSGRLGDSTPVSFSGFVNPDGTAPVYSSLYKTKGSFAARFSFEEIDFLRVKGEATWFKPKTRTGRYRKGFNKVLEATGAIYTASIEGSAPLEFSSLFSGVPNASVVFEGAGFGKGKSLMITVPPQPASGRYEIEPPRPNKRKVSARIDARTGYFVGTVREHLTNANRRFRGVFLQGYNLGVGVLDGASKTGAITLTPSEAVE